MTTYTGSCHCGGVKFEVDAEIGSALECNCSICYRRAAPLAFIPKAKFRLLTPEQNASSYTFNKHAIRHRFCSTCGIHVFGEGTDPESGEAMCALNLRCVDDLDLAALPVHFYDGRAV